MLTYFRLKLLVQQPNFKNNPGPYFSMKKRCYRQVCVNRCKDPFHFGRLRQTKMSGVHTFFSGGVFETIGKPEKEMHCLYK